MQKFFTVFFLLAATFGSVLAAPVARPVASAGTASVNVEDPVKTLADGTVVPFNS